MSKWLVVGGVIAAGGLGIAAVAAANRAAQRRAVFCGPTSTAAFRRQQLRDGVNLDDKDICHIYAAANGGLSHRHNYFPCPKTINRSLGHRGDHVMCSLVGAPRCRRARRLHGVCGTRRPT